MGHWRRGWDSNPRYRFPYTAFPVLPVKPLLHLSGVGDQDRGPSLVVVSKQFQPCQTLRAQTARIPDTRLTTPDSLLAERVGFEPTVPLRVQRFSRPPDSATLAPLRSYSCSRLLRKKDCIIDLHSLSRTPSSTITR